MGEAKKGALKIRFDRRLRLEFHGTRITSDAGLLACRELDDALGLTVRAPVQLQEIRHGRNIQHELAPLLRQSVYSRLAGYEDTNDAERLAQDPAMQAVVGRRALEKQAAGANTLSRFETEVLTREENLKGPERAEPGVGGPGHGTLTPSAWTWTARKAPSMGSRKVRPTTATFVAPVITLFFALTSSGTGKGRCCAPATCTAPMAGASCFRPSRPGMSGRVFAVTSEPMPPLRARRSMSAWKRTASFTPSAFPPTTWCSERSTSSSPARSVARPRDPSSSITTSGIRLEAGTVPGGSWRRWNGTQANSSLASDSLLTARPEGVVHFYNQRGTAEQWIKEGKYALNWTRLSCHRFVCNQVRLLLFVLAYNLGNFLRRLALPRGLKHWSLRSLQVKLIKMGGRIVRHARQIIFQLAEVAVSREEFAIILDRINRLRPVPV